MRSGVATRGNQYFAERAELLAHLLGRQRAGGEFGIEEFENDLFGKAHQIRLRSFRFLRSVVRYGAEQQMHRIVIRFGKSGVDGAGRVFRRKATSALKRRS